jgi:putative transposase
VDDLELATLNWVHWYNQHRLHSGLGCRPPNEYEHRYCRQINLRQQQPPG